MADRLRREDQRVEIDLLEVLGRLFLELDVGVAALGTYQTGMVRALCIGGQEAAAMRPNHFQARKAIERSLEDQVGERHRRPQGVADGVGEPAVAGKPLVEFGNALRMDEQGYAEFLGLGPYRVEFRSEEHTSELQSH